MTLRFLKSPQASAQPTSLALQVCHTKTRQILDDEVRRMRAGESLETSPVSTRKSHLTLVVDHHELAALQFSQHIVYQTHIRRRVTK